MTAYPSVIRRTAFAASFALAFATQGKPPVSSKEEKKPAPIPAKASTADETGPSSFLRWLLLQNGGPEAVTVGWPELVRATTGKQVSPLDPAHPIDATITARFGTALDLILPRINRTDGALRTQALLTSAEISSRSAEQLRTALMTAATTVAGLSDTPLSEGSYPDFRCVDVASGRTYYFSVALCPPGGREAALRALTYRANEASKRITADGCCLLIVIEHNGKAGTELAFLNWELIDLAKVSVRCAVRFEADENALHQPGTVIADGRKGRD